MEKSAILFHLHTYFFFSSNGFKTQYEEKYWSGKHSLCHKLGLQIYWWRQNTDDYKSTSITPKKNIFNVLRVYGLYMEKYV